VGSGLSDTPSCLGLAIDIQDVYGVSPQQRIDPTFGQLMRHSSVVYAALSFFAYLTLSNCDVQPGPNVVNKFTLEIHGYL